MAASGGLAQASRGLSLALAPTVVLTWGMGQQGALGIRGSTLDSHEPEEVPDLPSDIASVGAGHFASFAATSQGQLWSWGRGGEGQLGRETAHDEFGCSAAPRPVEALQRQQVIHATGSGIASFALCADGSLFAFGSSKRGQLGLGPRLLRSSDPRQLRLPGAARQVSAGWGHAAALLEDGSLWTWGWAASGRLGHSFAASDEDEAEERLLQRCCWEPRRVEALRGVHIQQVACGFDHTLALASDGSLFAFGDNSLGQLGRPTRHQGEHLAPRWPSAWLVNPKNDCGRRIHFLKVAAGLGHCLGLLSDGSLVSWGWNSAGQLGLGEFVTDECVAKPSPIYGIPNSTCAPRALIAAGRVHSMLVSEEAAGSAAPSRASSSSSSGNAGGNSGGSGGSTGTCADPAQLPLAQCYSWGSEANGRLGTGMWESAAYPEMVPDLDGEALLDVACGLDHTLVLARSTS